MQNERRIYLAEEVSTHKPRTFSAFQVPLNNTTENKMHPTGHALEVLVALLMATVVSSFPSGAPLSACGHLMPIHEDAAAQETASPFLILLSDTNYTSHEPIKGKLTLCCSPFCPLFVVFLSDAICMVPSSLSKVNQSSVLLLAFLFDANYAPHQPIKGKPASLFLTLMFYTSYANLSKVNQASVSCLSL